MLRAEDPCGFGTPLLEESGNLGNPTTPGIRRLQEARAPRQRGTEESRGRSAPGTSEVPGASEVHPPRNAANLTNPEMTFLEILFTALGLAMDAFAVSLGVGATGLAKGPRAVFRLSFHFGLFQFLMPVLGWLAGSRIAHLIGGVDHWVAAALLVFVGARMIRSGLDVHGATYKKDPSRGGTLVMLSVATSIDAFAIGLGLAMLRVDIIYPSVVIGIVTGTLSLIGLGLGHRLGSLFGRRMEILGGLILIGIALRILIVHLG